MSSPKRKVLSVLLIVPPVVLFSLDSRIQPSWLAIDSKVRFTKTCVGVDVGVSEAVGVGETVDVSDAVKVGDGVGVGVDVGEAVGVGETVDVSDAVKVGDSVGVGVAVFVAVGVGVLVEVRVEVGSGVFVGADVGVAVGTSPSYSKAPGSHCAPCGRAAPRWSVTAQDASSPASMAGEPGSSAMLRVGPPLSASGPSSGSPVTEGKQIADPSSTTLLFPYTMTLYEAVQSPPPALFAKMLLYSLDTVAEPER